ncbi:MAG: hypothetical protein QM503_14005 [Bacteroidota bacterium]
MNKLFSILTSSKTINWLIYIVSALFVVSLYDRYIYIDDAWFGEQVYWFSQLGHVKTSTIIDFHGWDNHLFVYHKLNIIIGAGLIKLFGWSVAPLRVFTLGVFLLFLYIIHKNVKDKNGNWNQIDVNLVMFFIIVNPQTILYAFTYRPEFLVMSFGFYSFLLLFGKQSVPKIILSGALAGMAILAHLNGAMFVVAGFVLLLIRKEFKLSIIFGISATIITTFYFYDLLEPGNLETFLFQIKHWPDDITTNYESEGWMSLIYAALIKLTTEHQRFFWSHDVWGLSAMAIFTLIAKGKVLWRKYKELIIYTIVADISLNVFGSHIAEVNMLLLLPFLVLISAAFLSELKKESRPIIQLVVMLIMIFQISVVSIGFVNILNKQEAISKVSETTLSSFPNSNERILVPYRFVFNQLPNKNLVSYKTMEYHQVENGSKYTKEEFIEVATKLGIYYMVISPEMYAKGEDMYPWIQNEFEGMSDKYIKIKIDKKSHALELME